MIKKICIVIPSLIGGGAEKNALLMASELSALGHIVTVLYFYKAHDNFDFNNQIDFICIGKKNNPVADIINIRKAIKDYRPSCVISFLDVINIYTYFAILNIRGIRFIANERSNPFEHLPKQRFGSFKLALLGHVYRHADKVLSNSKFTANQLVNKFKINSNKVDFLYNPINIEGETSSLREGGKILAVGRLSKEKDYPTLLKAVHHLVNKLKLTDFTLTIAGKGPLEDELKQLAVDLGIVQYINFIGFSNDIPSLMRSHDIYVLSSLYEGFPNTLLEAMSFGMAVIATDCVSGPSEVVIDGKNGFLIDINDSKSLAIYIEKLLSNRTMRETFAHNAINSLNYFSFEAYVRK